MILISAMVVRARFGHLSIQAFMICFTYERMFMFCCAFFPLSLQGEIVQKILCIYLENNTCTSDALEELSCSVLPQVRTSASSILLCTYRAFDALPQEGCLINNSCFIIISEQFVFIDLNYELPVCLAVLFVFAIYIFVHKFTPHFTLIKFEFTSINDGM